MQAGNVRLLRTLLRGIKAHPKFASRTNWLSDLTSEDVDKQMNDEEVVSEPLLIASVADPTCLEVVLHECQDQIDPRYLDSTNPCWGNTALHVAARKGIAKSVELLLQAKASVDVLTNPSYGWQGWCFSDMGASPLHLAVVSKNVDAVRLLVNAKVGRGIGWFGVVKPKSETRNAISVY